MPNTIKYKTGNLTGSLQKSNVALGVTSKGPTSTTGFYAGAGSPPSGKYFIYKVDVSNPPKLYAPASNTELINFVKNEGATGANTGSAAAALSWIATQTNLIAANIEYEGIVTDGLVLNSDAGFVGSYPTTGTTWYDLSGNTNNGTLINGPTFNSANSGSIVFDRVDDYAEVTSRNTNLEFQPTSGYSCMVFYKSPSTSGQGALIANMDNISGNYPGWDLWFNASINNTIAMHLISQWGGNAIKVAVNYNYSTYSNQWLCFGYTYDGSCPTTTQGTLNSVNFYLNGQLYTSGKQLGEPTAGFGDGFNTSSTTISYNTSQRFRVASRWNVGGPSSVSSVTIGIVLVYNRTLSASEMLQNYNAQKGRFGL